MLIVSLESPTIVCRPLGSYLTECVIFAKVSELRTGMVTVQTGTRLKMFVFYYIIITRACEDL